MMGSVICTSRSGHRGPTLRGRVISPRAGVGMEKKRSLWPKRQFAPPTRKKTNWAKEVQKGRKQPTGAAEAVEIKN